MRIYEIIEAEEAEASTTADDKQPPTFHSVLAPLFVWMLSLFGIESKEDWKELEPEKKKTVAGKIKKVASGTTRGIRNNNPGNIRKTREIWEGEVYPGTDSAFKQFETPEAGLRAMAKLLKTYQTKYNRRSIAEIISRWAPPSENRTADYIRYVARQTGVDPHRRIDLVRDDDLLKKIMTAMIHLENGGQPYSVAQISDGIAAA